MWTSQSIPLFQLVLRVVLCHGASNLECAGLTMLDNCGKTFIKCPFIWTFKGPKHFNLKEFSFLFLISAFLSIACNFYLNHACTCNKIRAIQSKPRPDESTRPRVIPTGAHLIQKCSNQWWVCVFIWHRRVK